ncbi:thymidine phosphorylase [Ruegeria pomeroyi]|uniref:Thymidine phosphorylase n=2 Tax=Ruegeria pomeroyi TaxID=89184 RepID=Q5LPB9_RUEPO|nr:thymidine phosphorylase [Ruegeria pomeroyi]AAV96170.1 thymidine phosphorylase [Ruegeria pomeroyi DSS-3]NVK97369.1 thymidine phosphorylase [Ruegeria pomeroyi]NVL00357.1 thymidine phosphorylase [Ruegeria pomeroyi]QWV09721.1 thymidine phosphorylase [Ruegeria pomeroyi]
MDARAIIARLRRHEVPSAAELTWFAQGLADGSVSDAQAGAFAMGVCMGRLGSEGRAALTLAMRDTGDVLHWDFDGPVIDKHSTGGVGDCVSLVLAPALAECGTYVPMISGRGLGHTGGTLDKMEAIPGVTTQLGPDRLAQVVRDTGAAIVGATARIAPADKRLYAIRDVTATVESLDLITASILSKKLAASPDALVLDVKLGSGAFMKSPDEARALALALTETANAAGCRTSALITDMSQPLAPSLGNALEVGEVMRVLTSGHADDPLAQLSAELGGVLLSDAGLATDAVSGAARIAAIISDGRAAERFGRMIAAVGGPVQFVENWQRFLPEATVIREVPARASGYVTAIDGEVLGLAVVALGGGRQVETDVVDPAVGLSRVIRLGTAVNPGTPLATIHAARQEAAEAAEATLRAAITIGPEPVAAPPLIHERITP